MTECNVNKKVTKTKLSTTGYDHYIAIDWSQVNIALARSTKKSLEPKVHLWEESDVKIVKDYISALSGTIIMTIEETTTSHWLYVELKEYVDKILICDPYKNRLLSSGPKTDKIDAVKLCQLLRAGLLKEVYHTDDKLYNCRQLLSAFNDLKNMGVRLQNQRSALYRAKGFHYSKAELPELKKRLDDRDFTKFITDWQDLTIEEYFRNKELFEKIIFDIVKNNKIMKNLSGITGIGTISAFEIVSIVVQAERFKNRGNYLSYCGLVLHQKFSGNRSYGKRRPRYNRTLHSVYKRAARVAINGKNNAIYEYYEVLIKKGLNHKQATLSIARYIAKVTFGMMKSGKKYEPYKWRKEDGVEKKSSTLPTNKHQA